MKLCHVSSLHIAPNRQRSEHPIEAHQELVESIRQHGILHPPVVRTAADGTPTLIAGERRYRAMSDIIELGGRIWYAGEELPEGFIPVNDLGDLSPLEAEEAELEENIRRVDLTWQECTQATLRLANLREAQHAADPVAIPKPTLASLAQEVKGKPANNNDKNEVSQALIVARHLDRPEVAAAKNVKDALTVIRKIEQADRRAALASSVGATFNSTAHTLINGDSLVHMAQMADGTFDVILTDPPYGMNADEFGDSGTGQVQQHGYDDSFENMWRLMEKFLPETYRIAKAQAHLYLFCDAGNFGLLSDMAIEAGWKVFRTPLIWHKPHGFRAPWPEQGPQRKYETILYAVKGGRKVTKIFGDVITCGADEATGHKAQKPVELFVDLLKRSVMPGDAVLDAFAGSGPILAAAHALQCKATAIELDPTYYGMMLERMKGLQ